MGVDINNEVMKAGDIMSRFRMPREEQIEVVRILMAAGVEHCLQEQEKVRADADHLLKKAYVGPGLAN